MALRLRWPFRAWPRRRLTRVVPVETQLAVPDRIKRDTVVVVTAGGHAKWAVFECPCERGHQVSLNLDRTRRPYWRMVESARGISISPSVRFESDPYCHYTIREGVVRWAWDSGARSRYQAGG